MTMPEPTWLPDPLPVGDGEVLVLVAAGHCESGMRWNAGGPVESPRSDGRGPGRIIGLKRGEHYTPAVTSLFNEIGRYKPGWAIVRTIEDELVDARSGRGWFIREGEIAWTGTLQNATELLSATYPNAKVYGLTLVLKPGEKGYTGRKGSVSGGSDIQAVTGEYGCVSLGDRAAVQSGLRSTIEAGRKSNVSGAAVCIITVGPESSVDTGPRSTVVAGDKSTIHVGPDSDVTCGSHALVSMRRYGRVKAGTGTKISVTDDDGTVIHTSEIGVGGLAPGNKYQFDTDGVVHF